MPEGCLDERSAQVRGEVREALERWRSEHTIEGVRQHYAETNPAYTVLEQATGGCLEATTSLIFTHPV